MVNPLKLIIMVNDRGFDHGLMDFDQFLDGRGLPMTTRTIEWLVDASCVFFKPDK